MSDNSIHSFFFHRSDGLLALRKGLDTYSLRQKVQAENIANVETPKYAAREVHFEEALKKALDRRSSGLTRSSSDHLPVDGGMRQLDSLRPRIVPSSTPDGYNGINNVDIDNEITSVATNQIQFAAASKIMGIRYRMLKSAITGRVMG
jgi:flagellar basal-body rod protein FlgB